MFKRFLQSLTRPGPLPPSDLIGQSTDHRLQTRSKIQGHVTSGLSKVTRRTGKATGFNSGCSDAEAGVLFTRLDFPSF